MKLAFVLLFAFRSVVCFAETPSIRGEVDCGTQPGIEKARSLVLKATEQFKKNKDALLKEIGSDDTKWKDGGVAIFAYEGTKVIAHASNPSLIGRELAGVTDVDGVKYVESFARLTTEKGDGCVAYRFPNPANGGKVETRIAFLQRADGKIYLGALTN